jgi:hypothetical protein
MKAILFGLIVIGILILVSCRAMNVPSDTAFLMNLAFYGRYAPPAADGLHSSMDGDNRSWL